MKREMTILLLLAALFLCACGQKKDEVLQVPADESYFYEETVQKETLSEQSLKSYSYEGTVFRYAGEEYDLSARTEAVNAITDCTPVGKCLVIEGHCGPKNSAYSIFNTETKTFEKDIIGGTLIWHDDDITTVVYSFWSGIYDYDGNQLAELEIAESDFIKNLEFSKDYSEVVVTIETADLVREERIALQLAGK